MKIIKACYTYAMPGYWLEMENGYKEYGEELNQEQKDIVHRFPCNVFKNINQITK